MIPKMQSITVTSLQLAASETWFGKGLESSLAIFAWCHVMHFKHIQTGTVANLRSSAQENTSLTAATALLRWDWAIHIFPNMKRHLQES